MSKRNRRRTRGGMRRRMIELDAQDMSEMLDLPDPSTYPSPMSVQSGRSDISARHWQNRFMVWQIRERRHNDERERRRQDQRRIFGGDSQDSSEDGDRLCSNMMAFFDGLDYLKDEPSREPV